MPTLLILSRWVGGGGVGKVHIFGKCIFLSFYFVRLNETVHAILVIAHRGAAKGSDEHVHTHSFTREFAALMHKVWKYI